METNNTLKLHKSAELFNDTYYYIYSRKLYYAYFQEIPNIAAVEKINTHALKQWIERNLKEKILKVHTKESFEPGFKSAFLSDYIFILKNRIIIDIEGRSAGIFYPKEFEEEARLIINKARKFKRKKEVAVVNVVIEKSCGLETKPLKCHKKGICLQENYNDDLVETDRKIVASLKEKNTGGLYLFHGLPGTGKTSYIRSLIHRLKTPVIILPVQVAEKIDSPNLILLLIDNNNSVLVIEDAERLLVARDSGNNNGISAILNVTDGLVSDGLGVKIICTFNTHLSNIDKALLRKGRLKALYEFKPLEVNKTKALLNKIGVQNFNVTEPMTLADIYNYKEQGAIINMNERHPIGFTAKVA